MEHLFICTQDISHFITVVLRLSEEANSEKVKIEQEISVGAARGTTLNKNSFRYF